MTKQTGRKSLLIGFYVVAISLLLLTLSSCESRENIEMMATQESEYFATRTAVAATVATVEAQEAATADAEGDTAAATVLAEREATVNASLETVVALATSEAEATRTARAAEDICSLLPVDVTAVFADQTVREPGYGGVCTASIHQYLDGGDARRNTVSIVKYESETEARESFEYPAGPRGCGHADWLPAPIGDAGYGYACPDVDEEYREGVAQAYYSIYFLQGPYSVQIRSSYPGQEDTILDIGRQIIDSINSLPDSSGVE